MKFRIFIIFVTAFLFQNLAFAEAPDDMVLIPEGNFIMGSDQGPEDEMPSHTVYVDAFYIDKYEVNQQSFEEVMGFNPSKFKKKNHPAESMLWSQANDYCAKFGKRLPTEAEWEKAARAGKTTIYFWGDQPNADYGWFGQSWVRGHFPVGQKKPNAYGLYDMTGNVWEWTADWYEMHYYKNSPKQNPKGSLVGPSKHEGGYKVVRGGAWGNNPDFIRTTKRYKIRPDAQGRQIGFRCVRSQ